MPTLLARLPAFIALLAIVVGALSSPEALALMPPEVATIMTIAGGVLAALTRPLTGNKDDRP